MLRGDTPKYPSPCSNTASTGTPASSNANTLDAYEEGTWTPAFSSTGATFAYSTQSGTYRKIGKLVYAQFILNTSGFSISVYFLIQLYELICFLYSNTNPDELKVVVDLLSLSDGSPIAIIFDETANPRIDEASNGTKWS